MGDTTGIQWTDATWNPVTGCSKVSPGCAHCYAEGVAKRLWPTQYPPIIDGAGTAVAGEALSRPRAFTDVMTHADRLDQPLRWTKPRLIFVNSMSDLFHEDVPDDFIDRVFAVMARARQHTFQILTKRAERARQYVISRGGRSFHVRMRAIFDNAENEGSTPEFAWPLPNVWLGVSVENQHFADERIPLLLQTPAAVRFLSCEPLLEGIDIGKHRPGALGLHWCIVGGESGPGARPCETWWVKNLIGQCRDADVAPFVKQLGAFVKNGTEGRRMFLRDRKGGDPSEWPEGLRVREFPPSAHARFTPSALGTPTGSAT